MTYELTVFSMPNRRTVISLTFEIKYLLDFFMVVMKKDLAGDMTYSM